jgi:hypothetical protein
VNDKIKTITISVHKRASCGSFTSVNVHRRPGDCELYIHVTPASLERLRRAQDALLNSNGHKREYQPPTTLALEAAGKTWDLLFIRYERITGVLIVNRDEYPKHGERAHTHNAVGACKRNPADADNPAYADRLAVKRACGIPAEPYSYNVLGSDEIARQVYAAFRAWQRNQTT